MDNHLTRFDDRFGIPACETGSAPVFLLSAGWRSGSTLLQRLLGSSGELLMWGEPYGRAGLIPAMTRASFCLREEWPNEMHCRVPDAPERQEAWIANMYPEPAALKASFRAQLDTLFAQPAAARGHQRWGIKEVRLQAMDARFLRWIYPDARFVFLLRSPWAAWSSAKGIPFYEQWPTRKVETVQAFAAHWNKLALSFMQWPDDSGMIVRYEDLIRPGFNLQALADHCQLSHIDPTPLQHKIRGLRKEPSPLSPQEVSFIQQVCGTACEVAGYRTPVVPGVGRPAVG
ncbi:MAG: sulfotransferase [Myxococcota bacterium]|nr:sulfotransferase [Myxococcota bacterium]